MGSHEPYWRTNTSFSPPPPRWDYRFQSEGLGHGSNDNIQLFGSTSSNSKESRSWMRSCYNPTHQHSASDGAGLFFSSPSDTSLVQPWTPPMHGVSIDEYEASTKRDRISGPLSFTPTMEGTSTVRDGAGSTSSRSDGSEFDHTSKLYTSTPRNFPSRRSFMSKPIHPLSFPIRPPIKEPSDSPAGLSEYDASASHRETHRLSSDSSSVDLTDISDPFESDVLGRVCNSSEGFKCGLCDRFLSQRSPWSSRRIIRSGDMPITGVLACRHVFHVECLEQITPKSHKNDPPCPLCSKVEETNSPEQRVSSKLKSNFPRLRAHSEDGSSKQWGCVQAGDCVEGALRGPRHSSILFNRNRLKKHLSLKAISGKDSPGKSIKTSSFPFQLLGGRFADQGAAGPSTKK